MTDRPCSPTADPSPAPRGSWWLVPPDQFGTACAAYNTEQRKVGESELPPPVRTYLHQLELAQHRADSDLPQKP